MNRPQFLAYLQARRDAGETLKMIGASLGVSHVTVTHWLSGKRNPSSTAVVLAGELCRGPMEMAAGLPAPPESVARCSAHLKGSDDVAGVPTRRQREDQLRQFQQQAG
jgi:hypothetical protein